MLFPGGNPVPPGEQTLIWRIFSPLWKFLVKKIESSIKLELLHYEVELASVTVGCNCACALL